MKKLMLSLAVACISAATAFAEPWFDNVVTKGTIQSGSWSADLKPLMGENNYITYKNMDEDLSFTVAGTDSMRQKLPDERSTVSTEVKFTAMDIEDFNEIKDDCLAGAKGGLTIVEDGEQLSFKGIVDGQWQNLTADGLTAADVIDQNRVTVKVEMWEDNGRKISYCINDKALAYASETNLAVNTGAPAGGIASIAYRGNCEISSLAGVRADEMWEITLTGLLNAVATLKVGTTTYEVPETRKVSIPATKTDDIYVSYVPAPNSGCMFFPTSGGKGESSVESAKTKVTGSQEISAAVAYTYAKIVAKVNNTDCYDTLAKAIAAGADKTVTVVSEPETDNQKVSYTMLLDAGDFTVAGNIEIAKGAVLTVLGGTFTGAFSVTDDGSILDGLILAGVSKFNQIAQTNAQQIVATKYFAKVYNETGSEIIEGTAPTQDIPVAYDPAVIPTDYKNNPAEYLNANAENGQKRWVNYALGLDPETAVAPNFNKAGATDVAISIGSNTPGNPGTGYEVFYTIGDSDDLTDGVINLQDIVAAEDQKITLKMKIINRDADGAVATVVTQKVIGAQKPTVSVAEKTDVKLVTVPYKQIDGSEMTIDEVINKANLYENDELHIFNGKDYDHYKLDKDGVWKKEAVAGAEANSVPTVKPGQGIWLKTAAADFFQYGLVEATAPQVELKAGWNLLGVASETLDVSGIAANDGDMIRVENVATKLPVEYTYDGANKQWTWVEAVVTTNYIEKLKRNIIKKTFVPHVVEKPIPVNGNGVWYVRDGEPTKISL